MVDLGKGGVRDRERLPVLSKTIVIISATAAPVSKIELKISAGQKGTS